MSPIYGLTDAPRSFLKLGQIRKGEKDDNGVPHDLDYFRVTFSPWRMRDGSDGAAILEQRFREVYGPRPTEINVRLAYPTVKENWDANYECHKKGGLHASAYTDATGAHLLFKRDDITEEVIVRNGAAVTEEGARILAQPLDLKAPVYSYQDKKGKDVPVYFEPVGHLNVVIRELAEIAVGFFEFRPESPRDIRNISSELASFELFASQAGKDITGVPFVLRRREEQVPKRINNTLTRGPSWVVHLDLGGEWANRALEVMERKALPEYVDAEVSDSPALVVEETPEQEHEPAGQPPEPEKPVEMCSPTDKQAVGYAANQWNGTAKAARVEIDKAILAGKLHDPMPKEDFKRWVAFPNGEPK